MLIVLVVLVAETWYPTWAWTMDERYDPQYHFMPPREGLMGIAPMQACHKQREIMQSKFPTLKFSCEHRL